MNERACEVFLETIKVAAPEVKTLVERLAPRLRGVGSMGGMGALAGAAIGAPLLGVRDLSRRVEARDGDQRKPATLGEISLSLLSGAAKGALLGGALGAGAGGLGVVAGTEAARAGRHNDAFGAASRVGQRAVHRLTGMLSPRELESMRGGAYDAREAYHAALKERPARPWGELRKAHEAFRVAKERQAHGLTSIPGHLRALWDRAPT